jgi:hypothetical protein
MKTIINLYKNFSFIFLTVVAFGSCKKFVQVGPPPTQIQSKQIFSDEQSAMAAANGLYSMLGVGNLNILNGGITLYTGAASDELYPTASNVDVNPFYTNSVPANHSNLYNRLWKSAYNNNGIYTTNAILEGLNSSSISDSIKKQLTGEVKVIRALEYFYLLNLFGDVPLVTTTDFETSSVLSRTSSEKIYQFLIRELNEASLLLDSSTDNRAKINKWAAVSLLARVYLYKSDWANAEGRATEVINSGRYSLNTNPSTVFSSISSNETIWQLARDNSNTAEGATFMPSSTTVKPTYALTTYLLNGFEPGDARKTAWISKNKVAGVDYYYPYKYKSRTATQPGEYYILLRLAELYLIRAEARAQKGDIAGASSDLNLIRTRAGLPNTTAVTQASLLDAVFKEKQTELFCELGHRWFDLKRTGKADLVLTSTKGNNWQSTDALLPIPQAEIDKNPNLKQNPGYQ